MIKPSTIVIIAVVVVVPVLGIFASVLTSSNDTTVSTSPTPTASPAPAANGGDPSDVKSAKVVILKTSKGDIRIELFADQAPKTVKNFVTLGSRGYYNDIIFHRVLKDFVIQAGDPTGTGRGGSSIYGAKFEDEINDLKIVKGSLAMANSGPNTNGSQFFIVTEKDQPALDGGYTNFGKVADEASMAVVSQIAAVPVNSPQEGRPLSKVNITGFEIVE